MQFNILLFFLINLTFMQGQFAQAETYSSMPLKVMSAEELLTGNATHYFEDFNKAIAGDCNPILERLQKNLGTATGAYSANIVLGEMNDRAICVPFDPAKAYGHFKVAADMGGPMYYAIVGWKYENGHGVIRSEEKANEAYKKLIQQLSFSTKPINFAQFVSLLNDRSKPILLIKGLDWYNKIAQSKEKLLSFGLSMVDGSGTYHDGSALSVQIKAAYNLLERLEGKYKPARHALALEELKGTFGSEKQGDAYFRLIMSARCGYIPSMLKLSKISSEEGNEHYSLMRAYGWLWFAKQNGANVDDELEKALQKAGPNAAILTENSHYFKISCK